MTNMQLTWNHKPSDRKPNDGRKRSALKIMTEMIKLLAPLKLEMATAITLGILGFIPAFGLGILGGYLILAVLPDAITTGLPFADIPFRTVMLILAGCAVARAFLYKGEQYFNHLIAFQVLRVIRVKIFRAMQRLVPAKLDSKNKGELISLMLGDVELLEVFYAHTVSPIGIAVGTAALLFVFNWSLHPVFAFSNLAAQVFVAVVWPLLNERRSGGMALTIRGRISSLNSQVLDTMRGIREIIQFGGQETTRKKWQALNRELVAYQEQLRNIAAATAAGTNSAILLAGVAQFVLARQLFQTGMISGGVAFIAVLTTLSTFAPFVNLSKLAITLQQTLACGERVLDLLEEEPAVVPVRDGAEAEFGTLQSSHLTFGYDDMDVLRGVDLAVKPGERVGIMGPSGCGKSTLLKLLMRFWLPQRGCVSLNGVAMDCLRTASVYNCMTYLTQETNLFAGTLRDNLLIVDETATDDRLFAALEKASLAETVRRLPKVLDTYVSELGENFSGGERQRLGLARIFLSQARILLLDEPTSNLDSHNEALILRALAESERDRSLVLVSHRPSTLAICDRIVRMEDGRIIEEGKNEKRTN